MNVRYLRNVQATPRILIDLYKTKDMYSGLGQFSSHFARELQQQLNGEFSPVFLLPSGSTLHFGDANTIQPGPLKRLFPRLHHRYDLWHSLYQFPSFPAPAGQRQLLTIHDLNFLVEKQGAKRNAYLKRLQREVDRAAAISTISQHSNSQIRENLDLKGKDVRVIPNGIYLPDQRAVAQPARIPEGPFLFSIGAFHAKKNFGALLSAMAHLPFDLVIAGNHDTVYGQEIKTLISQLGLEARVHLPGKVSEAEKQWYYAHCEGLVFPSQAEGFGMPVIEAMHHGKPVFINPIPALVEVAGQQAFPLPSLAAEQLATTIQAGLDRYRENPESHAALSRKRAAMFSWEACIRGYLELYASLLG